MGDPDAPGGNTVESSLTQALRARTERVDAGPDRRDLHRRERRYRQRRSATRAALGAATVAVVVVGIAGLVANTNRTGTSKSPTNPSTAPAATANVDTFPPSEEDTDWFLSDSVPVYERARLDGTSILVRTVDRPFADFADVEWSAPTGSAELCFGERTVLFGFEVGDEVRWTARGRFAQSETPVSAIASTRDLQAPSSMSRTVILLRVPSASASVVVTAHDGEETDRAPVVDQYAVIEFFDEKYLDDTGTPQYPTITTLDTEGAALHRVTFEAITFGTDDTPTECMPPPPPPQPLPPPGDQPLDPVTAEESIRARHALLVDRSIAQDDKPDDLLTDNTGVSEALEQVNAGGYAASAAGATYSIDDVVFVAPDHAWFRYAINTPTGLFDNRFGQAWLIDGSWRITRGTICNDLILASGRCEPEWDYEVPPEDPEWLEAIAEWQNTASRYYLPSFSEDLVSPRCREPLQC